MSELEFRGKYIISGKIECITGLHVGGSTEGFEIGGVDNPVIRNPLDDRPYIPGSSLKGKMRSLLEWTDTKVFQDKNGKFPVHTCENAPVVRKLRDELDSLDRTEKEEKQREIDEKLAELIEDCPICLIFGKSATVSGGGPTRLTVRDAFATPCTVEKWTQWIGETYTELKTENAIDRVTSEANPRTMERVPAGSQFKFEMIFDVYKDSDPQLLKHLFSAMLLLENSALGGSGTRGHGQVKFVKPQVVFHSVKFYQTGSDEPPVDLKDATEIKELIERFDEISWRG